MTPANSAWPHSVLDLERQARVNRVDVTNMFMAAGNGHFGSCFSCTEILIALYFAVLHVDPANPDWPDRDRFVMSKGHAAPTLYSALIRRGFFPEEWIQEYEARVGARLMTHPSRRYQPGVDVSTGALGHGLSVAVGMALGARLDASASRVYVLLGDGEINEGSIWEAAASASKFGLGNLVAVLDRNGLYVDGPAEEVMPMEPLRAKWEAFGWEVVEVQGHDLGALVEVLDIPLQPPRGRPRMVLAHTVKGQGITFMEGIRSWHADIVTREDYQRIIEELRAAG